MRPSAKVLILQELSSHYKMVPDTRSSVGKIAATSSCPLIKLFTDFLDGVDRVATAAVLDRGGNALPFRGHLAQITFMDADQACRLGGAEMSDRLFCLRGEDAAMMCLKLAR